MSLVAIWVDHEHAKVFNYSTTGLTQEVYKTHHHEHHKHANDQAEHQRLEKNLFEQFTGKLGTAEQILILGPGNAKQHLQKFLQNHNAAFAKKIVGCEAMDHPTDPQIIEYARKFFKAEHLS